jgi:molybdopterin synthase catalytic subunit
MSVRITREAFEIGAEVRRMTAGRVDVGAVVTFTGVCRGDDDGRSLIALTLETYAEMATEEIGRHVEGARRRWPLTGCLVVHRHGRILPGEDIVLVVTASAHRRAAFEAAEFLMDYLKTSAPFWKSEEVIGGERSWVAAKESDDAAAARWTEARP